MSIALAKVENLTCLYLELRRSLVTDPRFIPRFIVQSMRTKIDKCNNFLSLANSVDNFCAVYRWKWVNLSPPDAAFRTDPK